jgi:hypothetical protein
VKVQLTRKLALVLNGIDVSAIQVGDTFELPDSAGRMLIAEGWAASCDADRTTPQPKHSTATDGAAASANRPAVSPPCDG